MLIACGGFWLLRATVERCQGGLREGVVEGEEVVGAGGEWEEDGIIHQIDILSTCYPVVHRCGLGKANIEAPTLPYEHLEEPPRLPLPPDKGAI